MTPQTAFDTGSTEVNPNFAPTLRKIANIVKTYGKSTVSVIGYPDAAGGAADQATPADQRAEAVRDMLISMGIKPVLITASGNPKASGNTEVIIQPLVERS